MNKVAVIMSTYNGASFLHEQIDSIFRQKDVEISLFIRDDGSTDETVESIKALPDTNIKFYKGENIGVGNSFIECLYAAYFPNGGFDYYAFADQDDMWLPEKLCRGIEQIRASGEKRALYASNQTVVDAALEHPKARFDHAPDLGYGQLIRGNEISGCTFVFDAQLAKLLCENRPSPRLLRERIHDVWVAEVAALFGKIIYDSNSYILYRQHGTNVVGALQETNAERYKRKLHYLTQPGISDGAIHMCDELLRLFGAKLGDKEPAICAFQKYRHGILGRMRVLQHESVFRRSRESRLEFRAKVLLKKL